MSIHRQQATHADRQWFVELRQQTGAAQVPGHTKKHRLGSLKIQAQIDVKARKAVQIATSIACIMRIVSTQRKVNSWLLEGTSEE
jgi:hypothetical protein